MLATDRTYKISWEILPEDFLLEEEPVDNIDQLPIATALTDILQVAGKIPDTALASIDYGICATVDGKTVVKAPDWVYIPHLKVAKSQVTRSYTPHKQGDLPVVVIEIISDKGGSEYSIKRAYPPGKWFFYEQILQVPNYIILDPKSARLEVYRWEQRSGRYNYRVPDENDLYWLEEMELYIGVWEGRLEDREGYWLRWWDEGKNLLPWKSEVIEQERQAREAAEQAREAAEQQVLHERQAREAAEQQALRERQAKEELLKLIEELQKQMGGSES